MLKVISGLSIAQSEFAILQTILQASAAMTAGNFGSGTMLYMVAALMQNTLFQAQINKRNAEQAQAAAARIRLQIEAYRN